MVRIRGVVGAAAMNQLEINFAQRWRDRRSSFRERGADFDPSRYAVDLIAQDRPAREFVVRHHYSASYPAARQRAGLFEGRELVGVAVFSVPMQNAAVPKWLGCDPCEGVELGRFVLLDRVPFNAETWFLARAFKLVKADLGVRGVFACSDPTPRQTADGRTVMPGHVGTIYRAFNGKHLGRTKPRTLLLDVHGRAFSERALSKIRNEERGKDYALRQLEAVGAPRRARGENGADYVARVLESGCFRRVKHPGNLVYAWKFDGAIPSRGGE